MMLPAQTVYERQLRMAELADMLKLCLRESDSLRLDMVGIHLSNAVDAIKHVQGQYDPPANRSK